MKVGLQIPSFTYPGGAPSIAPTLADVARTADGGGFSSIWVMDHFFQIGGRDPSSFLGPAEDFMLESYSTLAYLAALTQQVRLGTLVTGVVYRYPGLLVKTVTTLDVLSGGRAYLGIGAAWNERESLGLGVPFPPIKERFERLEEALQIAKQMWSENNGPFHGKHYQLEETLCNPQPLSKPHPPILIGGMGEKKTLALVAKYADACNLFARMGVETIQSKLDVLKEHCQRIGRDYHQIEKTGLMTIHLAPGHETVKDIVETCRPLAQIGLQQIIFNMPNVYEIHPLETICREVIPALAEL